MKITMDYFINIAKNKMNGKVAKMVVPCPYEEFSIGSIAECVKLGLIEAILVGEKSRIEETIKKSGFVIDNVQIVDAQNNEEAANIAMQLLKDKKANMIMKGLIDTSVLLKTLLKPEYELRTGKLMSHCALAYNPNFERFFIITDAAMIIKPTLEQKKQIIENAVSLAHALGNKNPYVANLCAKEKPYEKMPDTIDAQKLQEMNQNGEIQGCVVSGPLQIDLAIDEESAKIKGCKDPVAGKANILMCPDIEAANIFSKGIVYLGGWSFAGVIIGSKVPFVLTSRSTSEEDRILSIVLACACAEF